MSNVNAFVIGSTSYDVEDTTARTTATSASTNEEYDRQLATGTYAGRSIMSILGESSFDDTVSVLHTKAQSEDGTLLRIGDYLDVTPTVSTVNKGSAMRYRIGAMGLGYKYSDTANPWAFWMVPDSPVDITGSTYAINTSYIYWNTTATNNGTASEASPYLASNLHDWELNEFLAGLPSSLQTVLVNRRALFETRYSASGTLTNSTGSAWGDAGKVFSLSETEVYGQCVWGTPGYSVGTDEQLPIFRGYRGKGARNSRSTWWLRSVRSGSSSDVCHVGGYGYANHNSATNAWVRPLPCFLIG